MTAHSEVSIAYDLQKVTSVTPTIRKQSPYRRSWASAIHG